MRELRNILERAVLLATGLAIEPEHLPEKVRGAAPAPPTSPAPAALPTAAGRWSPDAAATERARIIAALEAAQGNQSKAAELLGISRRTLLNRLDELDLPRPRKKK